MIIMIMIIDCRTPKNQSESNANGVRNNCIMYRRIAILCFFVALYVKDYDSATCQCKHIVRRKRFKSILYIKSVCEERKANANWFKLKPTVIGASRSGPHATIPVVEHVACVLYAV